MRKLPLLFLCFSSAAYGATPLSNVQMSGASNSVTSGSTLTISSGATLAIASGGTVTGLVSSTPTLTALSGLTGATDMWPYFTGLGTASTTSVSPFSRGLLANSSRALWFGAVAPAGTTGDILYFDGTDWVKRAIGTSGQVLTVSSSLPAWATPPAATSPTTTKGDLIVRGSVDARLGVGPDTYILTADSTQLLGMKWAAPSGGGGSGTVTSVAATVPSGFAIAGSPVTTSGTLAISYASGQAANKVLATPDGTTGSLSERSLVTGDLPTSGVTAATYGDATHVAQVAIDATGRVTSASNVTITGGGGGGTFPGSSTSNAIVRFNGTGGSTVKDSNVTLADSGTSLVFSGAAGLTAGGTSQAVTLTPAGSGVIVSGNAQSGGNPSLIINDSNSSEPVWMRIEQTSVNSSFELGVSGGAGQFLSDVHTADGVFKGFGTATVGLAFGGAPTFSAAATMYLKWSGGTSAGRVMIATTSDDGSNSLQVNGTVRIGTKTPSSSSDTGVTGTVCWDSSYIYVCTATNTWARAAIATW